MKRSLFSHVNDDLSEPESSRKRGHQQQRVPEQEENQQRQQELEEKLKAQYYHHLEKELNAEGRDHSVEQIFLEGDEDKAQRTLIEPHYPSIDLFEEDGEVETHDHSRGPSNRQQQAHQRQRVTFTVEDDEDDDELLELGDDGVFRRSGRHQTRVISNPGNHQQQQQVWMVDEWEEDLEGEMDELLDWAAEDDDEHHLLERLERIRRSVTGANAQQQEHQDDDQDSVQNFVLDDEDEVSPFERIFSESWLF
ncbi:hypothetical protein BGZ83_009126 [Gryganskiella cystojenkinii]|nr:hypothetical protein BGZ83_009126 [Gryganskiella cystojenkinii]